jgi:pyruvate oxidase
MGAWAAAPGRPIVAVTGDGGFAQYMAELTTALEHGMNITRVPLNRGQLGKISEEQAAGECEVWRPPCTTRASRRSPPTAARSASA